MLDPCYQAFIVLVKALVEQDARLSVNGMTNCTGISDGSENNNSGLRNIRDRWVTYFVTEECIIFAWELLKRYKDCDSQLFLNY